VRAVILAGGKGTRLAPYTTILPKPLVPIGERPILELLIRQLCRAGFRTIDLSVGHLGGLIKSYFDGIQLPPELDLRYWWEDEPLGTAGALRQIPDLEGSFLVMNGDILTTLAFDELLRYHEECDAALTIGTFSKEVRIDLGVIRGKDRRVTEFIEKPTMKFDVSMGVYAYDERVLEHIPDGQFDFPDVVYALMKADDIVATYPSEGVWFDIGTIAEYQRAVAALEEDPTLFADV
jgi:NDP-mannose synthase